MRHSLADSTSGRGWTGPKDAAHTHRPHPRVPHEAPRPEHPRDGIVPPPRRAQQLPRATHVRDPTLGQLPVPLVADALDALAVGARVHLDDALDRRLLADALDGVLCLGVDLDRVARVDDAGVQRLDGREGRREAVPLRLELRPALRDGERVLEGRIVGPERELRLGRLAGEQVEDGADELGLGRAQGDAGGGFGGGGVDLGAGGGHGGLVKGRGEEASGVG